jgi:histidine triad (HIT) family protein
MTSPTLNCLFCRIARGDVPARLVHETKDSVAFLDIHPIRPGHVLIVPREHFPYFDDLPPEVAADVMGIARKLAPALRASFDVQRVGLFFTGVDVAHAHAHVVPMVEPTDLTSPQYIVEQNLTFRPAPMAAPAALDEAAERIRSALAGTARTPPA